MTYPLFIKIRFWIIGGQTTIAAMGIGFFCHNLLITFSLIINDRNLIKSFLLAKSGFDFAQLYSKAIAFDLLVSAAEVDQISIGVDTRKVSCFIKTQARVMSDFYKAICRAIRSLPITLSQISPIEVQLTYQSLGYLHTGFIQ